MDNRAKVTLGAITDEFSADIAVAAQAMAQVGFTSAELRMVGARNVTELSVAELRQVKRILSDHGIAIFALATPLFKCDCPGAGQEDTAVGRDVFGAQYSFADQSDLAKRSCELACEAGASMLRVFSFWRILEPRRIFDRVAAELRSLAEFAERAGLVIGLENEHACNVGTSVEAGAILPMVDHSNLKIIWDPANAHALGERAYPDGYSAIPFSEIGHVHVKDCRLVDGHPVWCRLGDGEVAWKPIVAELLGRGYSGRIHLETHWRGSDGNRLEASRVCAEILREWVESAAEVVNARTPHGETQ